MRRSEEIQKLIDKVVLNEQVRAVKQSLSKQELMENKAYLENPKLYEEIEDAFNNDEELKQRIETQVNKNKLELQEKLDPSPEVKEDNILMLRALKSMYENEIKKEKTKEYKNVGAVLVKLDHLAYANDVREYIKDYSGGKISGEDEIRKKNKKVFDAVKFIQKNKHGEMLNIKIREFTSLTLKELEMALAEVQDIEKFDVVQEAKRAKRSNNISDYKDMIADLKSKYEPKDEKYTDNDKLIIQSSKELQGKNYGDKAITVEGQLTAIAVRNQTLFQRFTNRVKSIFSRKPQQIVEIKPLEDNKEEDDITVSARRGEISPKVDVDIDKANELAKSQISKNDIVMENDF